MQEEKRILYICNLQNTFTDIDEQILRERYEVHKVYVEKKNLKFIFQTWSALQKTDVIVAWFASWHSLPAFLMASLLRKPRILITGGYDVANNPEIAYGLRQGGLPYIISDLVFRLTTLALPFSETATNEALKNTPLAQSKIQTLRLGVSDNYKDKAFSKKFLNPLIITVGGIEAVSIRRKGIREFVLAAKHLPNAEFVVVGKHIDHSIDNLREIASENVTFTGYISDDDLDALLQEAQVYVQASYHEGFGLSVAEAMLAECIPVVSENGSLPEVVGDTGFYIDEISPENIASYIQKALADNTNLANKARQRILDLFSIEARKQGLHHAIESVFRKSI